MRRLMLIFILAIGCLGIGIGACSYDNKLKVERTETEVVADNYGEVLELAKNEFAEVFNEFKDIKIEQTSTITLTDNADDIVVQMTYSSSNGNGDYGFLYHKDEYGNFELLQQGKDVTLESLITRAAD